MNSNEYLLYASLEASKRLVEAGIVLETEVCWCLNGAGWNLFKTEWAVEMVEHFELIPAPMWTEVWIELPRYITIRDRRHHINLDRRGELTHVCYANISGAEFSSINPADALIDLLIWVRKEATDDRH